MERAKKGMPRSVIITIIATGVYIGLIAASQILLAVQGVKPGALVAMGLFLALLIMFARGMRLGRPILIFFIFISLCGVAAAIILPAVRAGSFSMKNLLIMLVITAPLATAFIAILRRSAKEYSGYICPACGSGNIKAVDIMYSKARCKDCGNMWY